MFGNFVPMTVESGPLSTPLSHDDHSQVVKPIVETDISRAASSFAKDSTLIKYRYSKGWGTERREERHFLHCTLVLCFSWRNEKATFTEKTVDIKTDKLPGEEHIQPAPLKRAT